MKLIAKHKSKNGNIWILNGADFQAIFDEGFKKQRLNCSISAKISGTNSLRYKTTAYIEKLTITQAPQPETGIKL